MVNRRIVMAYVLLVGLPLGGLLGMLHAGRHLTAPISVGGTWRLDADFSPLAGTGCGELLVKIKQPFFNLSQSGNGLVFNLNSSDAVSIPGTIRDTVVRAGREASESRSGSCEDLKAISLKAEVQNQDGERVLTGTLRLNHCEKCPAVPFRAVRQTPAIPGEL